MRVQHRHVALGIGRHVAVGTLHGPDGVDQPRGLLLAPGEQERLDELGQVDDAARRPVRALRSWPTRRDRPERVGGELLVEQVDELEARCDVRLVLDTAAEGLQAG